MLDTDRLALVHYRLQKAEECLSVADILLNGDIDYATILNRSYYAVFHAMRAILALEGKDFKKHSALISYFRQTYIKSGMFSLICSKTLDDLFRLRQKSDYMDFYLIEKDDAVKQLEAAKKFVAETKTYINKLEN